MGKKTGFLDYQRIENPGADPMQRIQHYKEFHTPLSKEEQEMKEIEKYFGINIILSAEYFEYDKYGYTPCNDRSSFSKDHTVWIHRGALLIFLLFQP